MPGRIVGIDGGVSGAVALVSDRESKVFDMPLARPGTKARLELDLPGFTTLLSRLSPDRVWFERGQGVMRQSAPRAYNYGFVNGEMVGVTAVLHIPYRFVEPAEWKRTLKLIHKSKESSRSMAIELFPALAGQLLRKQDHGRAEALLIAHWARSCSG